MTRRARHEILTALQALHPVKAKDYAANQRTGLVIVDVVNGFCTPGCGPLAPQAEDPRITGMIDAIKALAFEFRRNALPIYVVKDQHEADRPERPYPPHCIRGSGHENLVDGLGWLEDYPRVESVTKDCINLVVGSTTADGRIRFYEWIRRNEIENLIFVGICTEICVAEPVLTLLSARNHVAAHIPTADKPRLDAVQHLRVNDIVVYAPGCASYDLPPETVAALGLPQTATHDADIAHHTGLWLMQSRGAVIADRIAF